MIRRKLWALDFWQSGWVENTTSFVAFLGLTIAILIGFHPATRANAGSDFKTLFASSWCFGRGIDAYSFRNIASVFASNGVIEPSSWYGHAPVYPPPTLALLVPFTFLPMVWAVRVWIVLSAGCLAWGTGSLAYATKRVFHFGLPLRILIIGLVAASPLVRAGLELGNVSIVVVGLCILGVTARQESNPWLRALGLVTAFILKPHIAFWVILALAFSRLPADKRTLRRTLVLAASFAGVMLVWSIFLPILPQFAGYRTMVTSELSNGSMSPGNRDLMEVSVQMTSLSMLSGYWFPRSTIVPLLCDVVLVAFAGVLSWSCFRSTAARETVGFEAVSAWCAFGLMATYHRDADGTILLFVLPLVLSHLRRSLKDVWAWAVFALVLAGSFGPSLEDLRWLSARPGLYEQLQFLWLRQASLATVGLALLLLAHLALTTRTDVEGTSSSREMPIESSSIHSAA